MADVVGAERDLASLVVPRSGSVVWVDDVWEPVRLLDSSGAPVGAVRAFLQDVQAAGRSTATQWSYAMDLLRWFRFGGPRRRPTGIVTTRTDLTAAEVVACANDRCDQENVIEQLKNGVNALRVPLYDLVANWAYMLIAALAWNLKSWWAMMLHHKADRRDYIAMEFGRFINSVIIMPAMVTRRARSITIRVLGYHPNLGRLFEAAGCPATARCSSGVRRWRFGFFPRASPGACICPPVPSGCLLNRPGRVHSRR
jgi:hypothetical protein